MLTEVVGLFIPMFLVGYMSVVFVYFCRLVRSDENILTLPLEWEQTVSACYFINLDRSTDRLSYMERLLLKETILCERFPAVDGTVASEEYPDVNLTDKELGKKLSHLGILCNVKRSGWTIVFEDDIEIPCNKLVRLLDDLPGSAEIVHFGVSPVQLLFGILTFQFVRHSQGIWKTRGALQYLEAYAIQEKGARTWMSLIEKNFYDKPICDHPTGIGETYFCHEVRGVLDLFNIFRFRNMSYIKQLKNQFIYLC